MKQIQRKDYTESGIHNNRFTASPEDKLCLEDKKLEDINTFLALLQHTLTGSWLKEYDSRLCHLSLDITFTGVWLKAKLHRVNFITMFPQSPES